MPLSDSQISIKVSKAGIPSGTVLLDDAANLCKGLANTLVRQIQKDLGYPGRIRPPKEAENLSKIVLSGVDEGSGVLQFDVLPSEGITGRAPSIVAATEIVGGINHFKDYSEWPAYVSATARSYLAAGISPVLTDHSEIVINVRDKGELLSCTIDRKIQAAMQEPEPFKLSQSVHLVGEIFDINIENKRFKVNTRPKKVTVAFDEKSQRAVDELRWQRVSLAGHPQDQECKNLDNMTDLRLASGDEVDGIIVPVEAEPAESTHAFKEAHLRIDLIRNLRPRWDSYQAEQPKMEILDYSIEFLRQAISVLLDHDISPPVPFVVPTLQGSIQFEWQVGTRELELEIIRKNEFHYLRVSDSEESEGAASRWEAIRSIVWLATGEAI